MPTDAILMGDFNFEHDALEYERMVGPATARFGRLHCLTGFVDAWVAVGHREDQGATLGAGVRIDHCFLSAALAPRVKSARIDTAAMGSDHQPVWVELDL